MNGFNMGWWWKSRTETLPELAAWLEHPNEIRQRKAAERLAAIGHPLAVRWILANITKRELAQWGVRLLEQVLDGFTPALDADCLREIASMANPLQRIPQEEVTRHGKPLKGNWQTYRAIDCSALRQRAQAECKRRAAATSWSRLVIERPAQPVMSQQRAG